MTILKLFNLFLSLAGIGFFLIPRSYANGTEILAKAELILANVDRGNQDDINYLWSLLDPFCKSTSEADFKTAKEKWIATLKKDLTSFKELKTQLGSNGTYALRTSLNKLIGFGQTTGLLEDSADQLRTSDQCIDLEPNWDQLDKTNEENKLTVFKNTLLYANLALGYLTWQDAKDKLKILYPEILPADDKTTLIPLLCCSITPTKLGIVIPNRGYIFGGNLQDGVCKGLDCSSFVSYCADCSERLATSHMEMIWKANSSNLQSTDPVVQKVQNEFEAIPNEKSQVKLGDMIIWRATTGNSGHVAIFKEWIELNKFIGIDDNRSDDKKIEGLRYREFLLNKPNTKTFVLRRR